jgi:hypothetical protein
MQPGWDAVPVCRKVTAAQIRGKDLVALRPISLHLASQARWVGTMNKEEFNLDWFRVVPRDTWLSEAGGHPDDSIEEDASYE